MDRIAAALFIGLALGCAGAAMVFTVRILWYTGSWISRKADRARTEALALRRQFTDGRVG